MKERQRWRSEEDAILGSYVKQYGPRDWHLVAHRMSAPFLRRDAKSCLERWKNYLKPGIKKGPLSDDEQRLVLLLQAKHGNKWKKIASEVPGRTAKRLGKWWEVFQEKQARESSKDCSSSIGSSIEPGKYDRLLEGFAEKLVRGRSFPMLPPWLSNSSSHTAPPPPPSVALSLSPSPSPAPSPAHWGEVGQCSLSSISDCCRELQEGYHLWAAHRKEAAWRLKRVELQLDSEKASKRREKMEEIEAKIRALKEEERLELERIEAEYREQILGLRREAEAEEQRLAEQWAAKHARLSKVVEQQLGCLHQWAPPAAAEANGR